MVFKIFLIIFCLFLPFVVQGASSIDINTALLEELEKITSVGPVLAQKIIEARPFDSLDDLIKVKGIGEITLQKIKDQGLAWVDPQKELEPKPELKLELELESEPGQDKETIPASYPTGIIFNEILPSPEGPDSENEWIELYNQNDFAVDLNNWTIKDAIGVSKTYTLSSKIFAQGYLVLKRPETKITLNNDNDELILMNPKEEIVDSVAFTKAPSNQSYGKSSSGWSWTTSLTPGEQNVIAKNNEQRIVNNEQRSSEVRLSEVGPRIESVEDDPQRIKLIDGIEKSSKTSVPLIAFVVAFCSSVAFLMIKSNLKSLWY